MEHINFTYPILIVALPVIMFLILGLGGKYMKPVVAGVLGTLSLGVMTVLAYMTAYQYFFVAGKVDGVYQAFHTAVTWLKFTDTMHIDLGIYLDPISVMMLVVITTVSLMVHIYSLGYMKGEKGFQRYYAFLSLFSFAMLGLVMATNIFQMYIFWELVGVSSFLLISFYYVKPSAVAASKKAFIVTRFADFFFLVGILLLSYFSGTFDFATITDPNAAFITTMQGSSFIGLSVLSWAMILIFMGGAGKSAMMPFHIWLPDAMEGPTPASALIHAATMVVAGVFLVARLFPVYVVTPYALDIIAWVGAITALFAAIVACTQTDIKRVLAFSTISQIAFMLTSLGVSKFGGHEGLGYMAGMFHLFTHAFFKALLFLCAGAIIHAVHSNEMDDMGGLWKKLPITGVAFAVALFAIAGIPFFSGFYSKDEILAAAFEHNKAIYFILSFAAGLTAFYMTRLFLRIFFYEKKHYHHEPHEAGPAMAIPLIILAIFAFGAGYVPFGKFVTSDMVPYDAHLNWQVAITSVVISVIGMGIAFRLYFKKNELPDKIAGSISTLYKWAFHKFYFDELWLFVTRSIIFQRISKPIAWFDKKFVDGFMDSLAYVTQASSRAIKNFQSGYIQQYALAYLIGALILVVGFAGWVVCFVCK
ncbi:NADH-quinone oxidoreductase subunit L [Dysgonomonas sp. PFB1-18]|uniref:NADH-quinone oxidoreductase subunit L n=1 Tax=unclassified Dysgonomonas TaxID=2630389 RepID=UPI0024733F63|nr:MULTISPECIES: NADH-quinone oxidoreductase subunit L [unclassified Dysgonomonas]MDH6310847.1 NADH-quinone oxidoreductase subunit L [Dysgonomonas sp. PF1-14]MDH6340715.1 NADH-quinone oxidoreductase subunit L [Dysgonomonas sp. PF1-16]MDH6382317.1 NADH-quinone oxidoreductase subunit L [Dysgonomonas sp. PFB1-18]MDH6399667.1 NADH-quinone oxidoreductase subunit L [Dysgonomonas sp. PF1-23]